LVKMLETIEKHLQKGYNHKAVATLEDTLAELHGMDGLGSGVFRSTILLKLCRALSGMNRHEEALDNCQQAYETLDADRPGIVVSPVKKREALEARAEAHVNDLNYDEAWQDLQEAVSLGAASDDAAQALERKLHDVQQLANKWKCVDPEGGDAAWNPNICGHPQMGNGENGRDHKKVLQLPANLLEISQEKQCDWLKRQHKKMARKWHPDKYKGNKKRAARKMNEASEAKEVLSKQLGCSAGGKRERRGRD